MGRSQRPISHRCSTPDLRKANLAGALLNNAPQLLERISTLTERVTELLNDKNQKSLSGILENTSRLTATLAKNGPQIEATIAETRATIKSAGLAAEELAKLAGTTNTLLDSDGRPMVVELRKTAAQAQKSLASLDAALTEAKPGIQALSNQTIPEIGQLVRDLRTMSEALGSVGSAGKQPASRGWSSYKEVAKRELNPRQPE